jgi:hypothetical protein
MVEATAIVPVLIGCTKIIDTLHNVRTRFKRAPLALSAIGQQCSAVHTVLSQLQQIELSLKDMDPADYRKQTLQSLRVQTSSCRLTLFTIEDILEELIGESLDGMDVLSEAENSTSLKAKFLIQEAEIKELVEQLKGYQSSMTSILTAFNA